MPTPKKLTIRLATQHDLAAILALNGQLNPNDFPLPPDEQLADVWRQLLDNPIMHTFVAERAEQIVGTCVLAIMPNLTRGARPFGLIENVVTAADVRGQGVGRALLQTVLDFAWQQRCYKVMLLTGRPDVVPFYERVNFHRDAKIGLVAKPPEP